MAMFHKDIYNKNALVEAVNSGLRVTTNSMGKDLLAELLMTAEISERARVTDENGFQSGPCYVTSNENIGVCDQKYIYHSDSPYALLHKTQGSVNDWNDSIGKYISKNSNLVVGAGAVFARACLNCGATDTPCTGKWSTVASSFSPSASARFSENSRNEDHRLA